MSRHFGAAAVDDSDDETVTGERSQPTEWFLLEGDRRLVAATILLGVFAVAGGAVFSGAVALSDDDVLTRSFAALVAGNFTLITITISINQLILAREFDTPDVLYEHVEEMIRYRETVAETADATIAPTTPGAFLDFLGRRVNEHAETLREETTQPTGPSDRELLATVESYTASVTAEVAQLTGALERSSGSAFDTLLAILNLDITTTFHTTRRIQIRHAEALSPEATSALEDLADLLEFVGVARQHLKTLYIQRELSDLSRYVFYAGVPALLVPLLATWVYGASSGATLAGTWLRTLVVVTAVAGFAPFAVFFSHLLRIATLTRRTGSLMPFKLEGGGGDVT
jgi:hypothetical protein